MVRAVDLARSSPDGGVLHFGNGDGNRTVLVGAVSPVGATSSTQPAGGVAGSGQSLLYRAAPGEANHITMTADSDGLLISDSGATAVPSTLRNCARIPGDPGITVRCRAVGRITVRVELGDGDDFLNAEMLPRRVTLEVSTGPGTNIVMAGDGDDRIVGGPGDDTLYGGYGDDQVVGGAGSDYVRGSPGNDVLDGGADFDFVIGDEGADTIFGGGDFDFIFGGSGADTIDGGPGMDVIDGEGGDDIVRGGAGDDDLHGGTGDDVLVGGVGNDTLDGDAGHDVLVGEGGDDVLSGRDGMTDGFFCGTGTDLANVDDASIDFVDRSCEQVRVLADDPPELLAAR